MTDTFTNLCENGQRDIYRNCCVNGVVSNGICVPSRSGETWIAARLMDLQCTSNASNKYICPKSGNMTLYCISDAGNNTPIVYYADTAEYECTGNKSMWVIVDENGNYFKAEESQRNYSPRPKMYYQNEINNNLCGYKYSDGWYFDGNCSKVQTVTPPPTDNEFLIQYILN